MTDILTVVEIQAATEIVHPLVATGEGIARWWSPDVVSKGRLCSPLAFYACLPCQF